MTSLLRVLCVTASALAFGSAAANIQLQNGTATFTQVINHVHHPDEAIDGMLNDDGWAIARVDAFDGTSSETAVWETAADVSAPGLSFEMHFVHFNPGHLLGRFRWSFTTDDRSQFADGLAADGDVSANWVVLSDPVVSVSGPPGMSFVVLPDDSILAGGSTADQGVYAVTFMTSVAGLTGLRLEALEHAFLPGGNGPGLFPRNGNFVLSELVVVAVPEPSTLISFAVGLMGLLIVNKRTRKRVEKVALN